MISEVENIKKGLVVSTVEFDTSRKIIGVATANLVPGPTGIAPLEKQGAFQVQNSSETIDFAQALNNAQSNANDQIAEKIELPVLGTNVENNGLKAPVTSDVISENPVQVENPSNLTGFEIPNIEAVQEEVQEEVPTEPVALDIQMPEMPSAVVADEPTGMNESLFEGAAPQTTSILDETVPTTEPVPSQEPIQQPEIQMNVEIPTEPLKETAPETVNENIMGAIPTTAPAEEIPKFDIEMPVIGDVAKTEVAEVLPETVEQPMASEQVAEAAPQTPIVESTPVVEETPELTPNLQEEPPAELVEDANVDEVLKTYKESMEAIISNFNKAQLELLNECVAALKKMKSVKNEVVEEAIEKTVEQQPVQETTVPVVQQAPQQQTQAELAPGNPLESAAFEIIDAMSAPKM